MYQLLAGPPRHGRWTIYEKYYDSQKSGQGAGLGFWTDGLFSPTNLGYHISTPGSSRRPGRGAPPVYSEWDPPGQKVPRGGPKCTKISQKHEKSQFWSDWLHIYTVVLGTLFRTIYYVDLNLCQSVHSGLKIIIISSKVCEKK